MNKTFKAAIAAAALIGAASGARADLSIDGAVGLPLNPTAQIPLPGGIRVQANYYDQGDNNFGVAGASVDQKTMGLVAAGRVADMVEINGGINRSRFRANGVFGGGTDTDNGLAIGAKYLFSRETDPVGVRFAVGAGYNRVQARNTYVYAVATKSLGELTDGKLPITGHLGLRYDRFKTANVAGLGFVPFDVAGVANSSTNKVSVYGGIEIPFASSFAAVGELQSKRIRGGETPYSASIRYRPEGAAFSGSIGIARTGIGIDKGLFAQIGYSFDGSK